MVKITYYSNENDSLGNLIVISIEEAGRIISDLQMNGCIIDDVSYKDEEDFDDLDILPEFPSDLPF